MILVEKFDNCKFNPANQNFEKVPKILGYGIKEHVLKTLGASIIYSSMSSGNFIYYKLYFKLGSK